MPSYISHSIMAEEIHNELKKQGIATDQKAIKTYSLIPDLASPIIENHNTNVQDYILYLIIYIKSNKLQNNTNITSLLYGIISHYYLDTITHPFIYSLDFKTKPVLFSSHYYIEGYLNHFLAEEKLKKNILLVKSDFCTSGKIAKESKILIDKSYSKIYGISTYKTIKKYECLIEKLETYYKKVIKDPKLISRLSGFNKYLRTNKITIEDIDNRNHKQWINPFTNEKSETSFLELYTKSLYECLTAIEEINKYLKNEKSIMSLTKLFTVSYDTGIEKPLKLFKK